jgi:hypothetical protein
MIVINVLEQLNCSVEMYLIIEIIDKAFENSTYLCNSSFAWAQSAENLSEAVCPKSISNYHQMFKIAFKVDYFETFWKSLSSCIFLSWRLLKFSVRICFKVAFFQDFTYFQWIIFLIKLQRSKFMRN